nr:MAG TPA: hypothetical protein [Caudoviricetes sp.]
MKILIFCFISSFKRKSHACMTFILLDTPIYTLW